MKWFAILLVLVNAALWYFATAPVPDGAPPVSLGEGTLPRVSTLKTVSEPGEAAASEDAAPSTELVELAAPPAPDLYCARIGWFDSEEDARAAGEVLGLDGDLVVEREERELAPLHWVLIPPQPPEQARAEFRAIQRRGIDSYLVTEGENRFAISLGLFESRTSAISVLEEKKRQNLNAILAIFPRNQLSYALVFEAGRFQSAEEIGVAKSGYQQNFDLVEIRPCEGVATPAENP